jgi:hypothetical protein
LDVVVVDEGFEEFAGSTVVDADFPYCSRSSFNIFDVSGGVEILAVDFVGAGVGFCSATAGDGGGLTATSGGGAELAMGLEIGFSTAGGFADAGGAGFTTFGAAFVDFVRVVVFFVPSDSSTSTGSEITFLGLPLFFTTSEDMLAVELGSEGMSLRRLPKGES